MSKRIFIVYGHHNSKTSFNSAIRDTFMEEAKKNNSPLPITKIIDEYYSEVQEMGGQRWDTSSLIKRFRK